MGGMILIERQRADCSDANISMIRLRVASPPQQSECSPISCIRLKGQMSSSQQTISMSTSPEKIEKRRNRYKSSDAPEVLGLLLSPERPGLVAEAGLHHYYKWRQ